MTMGMSELSWLSMEHDDEHDERVKNCEERSPLRAASASSERSGSRQDQDFKCVCPSPK